MKSKEDQSPDVRGPFCALTVVGMKRSLTRSPSLHHLFIALKDALRRPVQTEIKVELEEFEHYKVGQEAMLTFSLKEFKVRSAHQALGSDI